MRSARKHIGWALRLLPGGEALRTAINAIESCRPQIDAVTRFFDVLADSHERLPRPLAA